MNRSDLSRNTYQLYGSLAQHGYDWWWHHFTGYHHETGEEKSFFVEYFIINPALGSSKPLFGNPSTSSKPSYLMIKAGYWGKEHAQIHGFYPISALSVNVNPFYLTAGQCFLSEKRMKGHVSLSQEKAKTHPEYMSDAGTMTWDLQMDKKIAFHVGYGASWLFRKLNAFEMYWHAEGMKTHYQGTVTLNGERYDISPETCYGYADKNWGSQFTSPWLWLNSCHLIRKSTGEVLKNSVIDIGGGCPKIFGIPLQRQLLMNFFYEGQDLEYNFSKPWLRSHIDFKVEETTNSMIWRIIAQDPYTFIKLKVTCPKEEMLFIRYQSPDGQKRHQRLFNGATGTGQLLLYKKKKGSSKQLIDHLVLKHVGCEYGVYTDPISL